MVNYDLWMIHDLYVICAYYRTEQDVEEDLVIANRDAQVINDCGSHFSNTKMTVEVMHDIW